MVWLSDPKRLLSCRAPLSFGPQPVIYEANRGSEGGVDSYSFKPVCSRPMFALIRDILDFLSHLDPMKISMPWMLCRAMTT